MKDFEPREKIMSVRECKRRYAKIAESKEYYLTKNIYECSDSHKTVTIDIHCGTTPMIIDCPECQQSSHSKWYPKGIEDLSPSHYFYRPTFEQTLKLRNKPNTLDHVLKGGLLLCEFIT